MKSLHHIKKIFIILFIFLNTSVNAQLLSSAWNVGCYFNYYQPVDSFGPCYKCYVSSSGVAMGQIMKYWEHPNKGWGEHSFIPYLYGIQYANFEHIYNWVNMPDTLTSQNLQISRLLSDCDVSIKTNYSPYFYNYSCGITNLDTVRIALRDHFGYKNGQVIHRTNNKTFFENSLINEINNNRPVIMEVYPYNNQCSKFCVVDGYNAITQEFHINWGYGSYWNNWTKLDTMQFVYTGWGLETHALIGIEPDTMNVLIQVKYDETDDSITSIVTINNINYPTTGTLNLSLKKGWYDVTAMTTKPWGLVNSVDALIIMKHFVGMINLSGLKLICADVNNNGSINSLDALIASKRFTQMINSFPAGNWKFETFTINQTTNLIIHGRCVGDVN